VVVVMVRHAWPYCPAMSRLANPDRGRWNECEDRHELPGIAVDDGAAVFATL
jgi:hypothetical protein